MSVVFIVAPIVVGSWPAIAALAAAAAASLGYRAVQAETGVDASAAACLAVDVSLDHTSATEIERHGGQSLVLHREGVELTVFQDAKGHCAVRVRGHGKSDAELRTVGEGFLKEVRRQYAYRKVVTELRERGFELVNEKATRDGEIRLTVRRSG